MKRNDLLIAGLFLLILSFSNTAWGFPGYKPDIYRQIDYNYTIRIKGIHYSRTFFKVDVCWDKGGYDQTSVLAVSHCLTPEYQKNSKFIFLRMKLPPPELAVIYDDFEERQNAFDKEYRAEWDKRREEIQPSQTTGYERFNESMKPFNDQQNSFWKELRHIQEAALPETQRQDWSYYIIDKAKKTVTGPLSEEAFLASKTVGGKKIHWKPASQTREEYSRAVNATGFLIAGMICFPWFVLLLVIIGVIYFFCKKRKRARLKEK